MDVNRKVARSCTTIGSILFKMAVSMVFLIIFAFPQTKEISSDLAEPVEEIYYYVNTSIITKLDFEEAYQSALKDPSLEGEEFQAKDFSNKVISNMITEKVIEFEASLRGVRITPAEVNNEIKALARKNNIPSVKDFFLVLAGQGISEAQFRSQIERSLLLRNFAKQFLEPNPISTEEVQLYYDENKEKEFRIEEPVFRLATVLVKNIASKRISKRIEQQKNLELVQARVAKGELSFIEAVRQYSEDEASRSLNGNIGWLSASDIPLVPSKLEEFSRLNAGDLSKVYYSEQGIFFYLIREKIESGYIPYSLAVQQIRNRLFQERQKDSFDSTVKGLLRRAYIKPNTSRFNLEF